MSTLADPGVRASCYDRIARLDPDARSKWGRMTAPQMVCHLNDSFKVCMGEKYASPATNLFKRTVFKWAALRTSVPWPHGVATRPELEPGRGGTPPAEWAEDCAELRGLIEVFGAGRKFAVHPMFGAMSERDWLVWGYRHTHHHLRQFGV